MLNVTGRGDRGDCGDCGDGTQGIPFILVGTKLDLRDDQDAVKRLAERRHKPISFSEAQGLASDLQAYRYLECSALTQQGLKQASVSESQYGRNGRVGAEERYLACLALPCCPCHGGVGWW